MAAFNLQCQVERFRQNKSSANLLFT